jgi:hypothetical protein
VWAVVQGLNEVLVKAKNRCDDMRGARGTLQFNVIVFGPAANCLAAKVYLSTRCGSSVLDSHRSRLQVVRG